MRFIIGIALVLVSSHALAALSPQQFRIVEYYAPIIYQHAGSDPKGDEITRYDFDGDEFGDNNWDNLPKFPTPGYVYYDLAETETHYYLSYAFYHPRDYSYTCAKWICHENDLEGILITVAKTGGPMGQIVMLETMAHDRIYPTLNPKLIAPPAGAGPANNNPRVGIFSEWGGHGTYNMDSNTLEPKAIYYSDTWNRFFRHPTRFLYYYGGRAESPTQTPNGVASYQLLRIRDTLWNLQENRNYVGDFFDYGGSRFELGRVAHGFKGLIYGENRAHFPWAWYDTADSSLRQGDWFLDPAFAAQRILKSTTLSLKYRFNEYLGIIPHDLGRL